jgi:hypothetical protein
MAANTAFRAESVTFDPIDGGAQQTFGVVQVLTRAGKLSMRSPDGVVNVEQDGVQSVSKVGNRTWRIVTAEGAYTAVVKKCGTCR